VVLLQMVAFSCQTRRETVILIPPDLYVVLRVVRTDVGSPIFHHLRGFFWPEEKKRVVLPVVA